MIIAMFIRMLCSFCRLHRFASRWRQMTSSWVSHINHSFNWLIHEQSNWRGASHFLFVLSHFLSLLPFLVSQLHPLRSWETDARKENEGGRIWGNLICKFEYFWSLERHYKSSSAVLKGSALMLLVWLYKIFMIDNNKAICPVIWDMWFM